MLKLHRGGRAPRLALLFLLGCGSAGAEGVPGPDAAKDWFYQHVAPRLIENGCHACHATGHVLPNVLVYEQLLPYLGMGWTRDDNVLLYKMANLRSIAPDRDAHVGGQRCATPDVEPCATFKLWWDREFGAAQER